MDALVTTTWLEEHLGDADLRILDATVDLDVGSGLVTSGRARWEAGHIPGAAFVDLLVVMGRLGIGDGTRVVLYDARDSMWAARVWWLLRCYGFDDAAVLDGGWTAWEAEGRPVSTEVPAHPAVSFTPRPRTGRIVGRDEVLRAIGDDATQLVDALGPREFRGELSFYGRPGHLPGASNVPARHLLDRQTRRFRPPEELRRLFGPAVTAKRVVTYCGGGIAAASDAFALHLLGQDEVAVYDRSLAEWAADPDLPLVTGDG
ncbi:MAG: sulfurtransferase [Acidimicrobiales bacterium]|nr:sulfurtransferase [Acidimicrobiales bacterium]